MKRKLLLTALTVVVSLSLNGCGLVPITRALTTTAVATTVGTARALTGTALGATQIATRSALRLAPMAAGAAFGVPAF